MMQHWGNIFGTPALDATFRLTNMQDQHDCSLKRCLHMLLSAYVAVCSACVLWEQLDLLGQLIAKC
jgi:hypothetical protein